MILSEPRSGRADVCLMSTRMEGCAAFSSCVHQQMTCLPFRYLNGEGRGAANWGTGQTGQRITCQMPVVRSPGSACKAACLHRDVQGRPSLVENLKPLSCCGPEAGRSSCVDRCDHEGPRLPRSKSCFPSY